MTEIEDLSPDKPADEAPLTPKGLGLYLADKGAERPCEACGHHDFEMAPERPASFSVSLGVVLVACKHCNALRWFLRPPIVAWLKETGRG